MNHLPGGLALAEVATKDRDVNMNNEPKGYKLVYSMSIILN